MVVPLLETDGDKAQRNKLFALALLGKWVTHVRYDPRSREQIVFQLTMLSGPHNVVKQHLLALGC